MFISYSHGLELKNGNFNSTKTKALMDIAQEKGLKCVIHDVTLNYLSSVAKIDSSITENTSTTFKSQEDLNAYVAGLVVDIKEHPAFYGFALWDEPTSTELDSIALVYKAIKAADPDCYLNICLEPTSDISKFLGLIAKVDGMGSPDVRYDYYPLRESSGVADNGSSVLVYLKTVADYCESNNKDFSIVLQSSAYTGLNMRKNTLTDMYWQTNLAMAFGVKDFSYWTYYPEINFSDASAFDTTSSFVDRYGNTNDMYTWMQGIHGEMQGMAKALMNYEYRGVRLYNNGTLPGSSNYATEFANKYSQDSFNERFNNCTVNGNGSLLITEQYDEKTGLYGYFIVNASAPETDTTLTGTIDFGSFGFAQTYNKGVVSNDVLDNGQYSYSLKTGEGIFVIPYV